MSKVLYRRREFLEPANTDQTAYVYAYLEDHFRPFDRKGKPQKRNQWDTSAEFGLHAGNETLHLHFEWGRNGKVLRRDVTKLRKLASIATDFANALEAVPHGE